LTGLIEEALASLSKLVPRAYGELRAAARSRTQYSVTIDLYSDLYNKKCLALPLVNLSISKRVYL
jgi:hypothetical protein